DVRGCGLVHTRPVAVVVEAGAGLGVAWVAGELAYSLRPLAELVDDGVELVPPVALWFGELAVAGAVFEVVDGRERFLFVHRVDLPPGVSCQLGYECWRLPLGGSGPACSERPSSGPAHSSGRYGSFTRSVAPLARPCTLSRPDAPCEGAG